MKQFMAVTGSVLLLLATFASISPPNNEAKETAHIPPEIYGIGLAAQGQAIVPFRFS